VALIATDMFERGSDEHDDLRLELDIEPRSMTVFADPAQLNQVLTNLMSNAAHAMNHSGTILLWARSSADHDTIRITDDGPGIPEEKREHIFEALFTTKAKGSGLGLTICRQIVERHGGTIALEESKNPNHRGATFRIILPRNALDIDDLNNSTISARERQQNPETRTNRTHQASS
jgi:signal transduction histidine kinase